MSARPMNYRLVAAAKATPEDATLFTMASPLIHFASMVQIEDINKKKVVPIPNILQERIADAYEWCILNGVPPRIMVLKPRKKGASTFCGHICYHHARRFKSNGMMMGDETSRSKTIWDIFTGYAKCDRFPWDSRVTKSNTEKFVLTYKDGATGEFTFDTANDAHAGIGGTRQILWFTEVAMYARTGARIDSGAINSAMESMGNGATTLAFAESTPQGVGGWYYETWQGASWLHEAKAGNFGNGWIKVFAAWHEFADSAVSRDDPTKKQYFDGTLNAREQRGVDLYGWTPEQIAWRRMKMQGFNGDENKMDSQHPEDDVSCFTSSGRPVFCTEGLARLEKIAQKDGGERGILQKGPRGMVFMPDPNGWLRVFERPKHGCAYLATLDSATGEQAAGAKNPDAHASAMLRAPYLTPGPKGNIEHNAALVACIDVPNGCRWNIDLIAERTAWLADFYGGAMVVPESNGPGMAAILKLREHGARIYQRQKFDAHVPGKTLLVAGWETNKQTRDIAVEALASHIREQTFDCPYAPAVAEMRTFVENDAGKAEARSGAHDDWVMSLAIGLTCLRFASVYREDMNVVHERSGWGRPEPQQQSGKLGFT